MEGCGRDVGRERWEIWEVEGFSLDQTLGDRFCRHYNAEELALNIKQFWGRRLSEVRMDLLSFPSMFNC